MSTSQLLPNEITRPCYQWRKNGPLLSYGLPFADLVAAHVKRMGRQRVFVVVSGSLAKLTDHFEALKKVLGTSLVGQHVGFPSHVPWNEILSLVKEVRESEADIIVTLGGGSITDAVKLTSLCLANPKIRDYESLDRLSQTLLKSLAGGDNISISVDPQNVNPATMATINIPTTLSCGEYTSYAGGIDPRDGIKKLFIHKSMTANVIILDPDLALSVPEWVWMSTGVRSIDHAVETLSSLKVDDKQLDKSVQNGLAMLAEGLLKLKANPMDVQSRLQTQLGSVYASDGLARGVHFGGSHAIGHQLGTMNVAHGHTSCILMPAVAKYNARVNKVRQALAQDAIWSSEYVSQVLSRRGLSHATNDLGDTLDGLFREYGMPRTLKEVGVEGDDQLQQLANRSLTDIWCATNPIPLTTEAQVLEILRVVEA